MSSNSRGNRVGQQGFTLIELIITLVVFAILATMLVTVMGTSVTSSGQPAFMLQRTMALQQTMENIRANFAANGDLALLKVAIGTGQQDNAFGRYEVIDNRYVKFSGHNETEGVAADGILKVSIKDQETGVVLTELLVEW